MSGDRFDYIVSFLLSYVVLFYTFFGSIFVVSPKGIVSWISAILIGVVLSIISGYSTWQYSMYVLDVESDDRSLYSEEEVEGDSDSVELEMVVDSRYKGLVHFKPRRD